MAGAAYDAIAEWYDARIRDGALLHDLVLPLLWELIGDVAGQRVCDLACGQGVVARWLARRGAAVVGVDLSAGLLAFARRYEDAEPRGIDYVHDDAQTLHTVEDAAFDGVACNMALMDIPDAAATFRAVRRVLRPGGWFAFSITHPCAETALGRPRLAREPGGTGAREVSSYFVEGPWRSTHPAGVRGKVDAHHRTLGTYVNSLVDAGLTLERLAEPQATGRLGERLPPYRDVPAVLVARCRRAPLPAVARGLQGTPTGGWARSGRR